MASAPPDSNDRLHPGESPDQLLQRLFRQLRLRLRRVVKLRLDRRLQGRVDPSDVLQEAYLEAAERIEGYCQHPTMPP
jgi:RNA polymerase sigma-70 factor (ECF subfamily)